MSNEPPTGRGEQPEDQQPEQQPGQPESGASFGSFVSDSVRRSAERFRHGDETEAGDQTRRFRPSRAQRTRRASRPGERQRQNEPAAETAGAAGGDWMGTAVGRAGGPGRALAAAVILLLAFVLLVWALATVVGGGDDGGAGSTATSVLPVVPVHGTPGAATPAGDVPTVPAPTRIVPTPTAVGSDNVLGAAGATPLASPGPPAVSCETTCLFRAERTDGAERILRANGTRPSYVGDDWLWAIAGPDGVAAISARLDTNVVRESAETLKLYMVVLPSASSDDTAVQPFGEVLDSAGRYRLVETPSAPANVRDVLDAGLVVEKVAPEPPPSRQRPGNRETLKQAGVGTLSSRVDTGRIEAIISHLQATSSTDGSGIGTRYYTTPGNQMAAEYLYRQLESYGVDAWYQHFVTPEGLLLNNVVGEIPGSDPGRIYGVMAHFDTISDSPETAAPGALDNATGISASLEIARILADYDLHYTFRVVFTNAEETGILGSDDFAADAAAAGEPWEGIFNIDSVGSARHGYKLVLNTDSTLTWMEDLIAQVNDAYGIGESLEILQTGEIVADDNMVRKHGLEAVMVARELYGWSPYHHTTNDVMAHVSIPHVRSAAVLMLLSVASLVQ